MMEKIWAWSKKNTILGGKIRLLHHLSSWVTHSSAGPRCTTREWGRNRDSRKVYELLPKHFCNCSICLILCLWPRKEQSSSAVTAPPGCCRHQVTLRGCYQEQSLLLLSMLFIAVPNKSNYVLISTPCLPDLCQTWLLYTPFYAQK